MKNENGDEFVKWSKLVWDRSLPLIQGYKPLLVHKDSAVLLDLSLKVQAYDFGVLMQAKADFRKDNLENKSVKDFVRQEKETYSEEEIRKIKDRVNRSFKSSFDNKRSERIKELVLNEELSYIMSRGSLDWVSSAYKPEPYRSLSIKKDFEENWLPKYKIFRGNMAKMLRTEFNLSEEFICNLQNIAFNEALVLVNQKSSGYVSNDVKKIIDFLEQGIEIYFPIFLKDCGFADKIIPLHVLRKNTKEKFNTVCYRCGRRLLKKDSNHYCTRSKEIKIKTIREKMRVCYNASFKEARDSEFSAAILRTKNRCDNCGRYSSFNYIHKCKGQQMQFCSDRCWETFRKREWRRKKKSIN